MEIIKAETIGTTDLNLNPEYEELTQRIAKALSHIGDMDILIMKANHPEIYEGLLDI